MEALSTEKEDHTVLCFPIHKATQPASLVTDRCTVILRDAELKHASNTKRQTNPRDAHVVYPACCL